MSAATRPEPGVTVITLTRHRPHLVQRAIRSVQAQQAQEPVRHLVLVDECPRTMAALEPAGVLPAGVEVRYMPRGPGEVSGPGRSSRLRNLGVRRSAGPWIAFLDDDNEWTADHLQTLLERARETGVRACYSEVSLLNPDGSPYLEPRWPWAHTPAEAERLYQEYLAKGICVAGSNVIRDRPGVFEVPTDTSSWLLARELLLEVPFAEEFTEDDACNIVGEDDKLFWALVARGEPMVCTARPTLRYYLGGYSNNPHGKTDETFSWSSV